MRKILASLFILAAGVTCANAQVTGLRVVPAGACGTPTPYTAMQTGLGSPGWMYVDANGLLCTNGGGGGGGGTSSSFGAAFPATGTAAGAEYLSSPPTLTTGQMVALQTDINGNLKVAGLSGSVSNATSGVATGATNIGAVSWLYGFNGATWDQLQVDASKRLIVSASSGAIASGAVASGAIASGAIASGAYAAGSIASGAAVAGAFAAGAIADLYSASPPTPYAGSGAATTITELEGIRQGVLGNADPCNSQPRTINLPVAFSSATTTQVAAAGSGSQNVYVCELIGVPNGANNITLISGNGSNCATNQVTIGGPWYLANAGNGLDLGKGITTFAVTQTAGYEICVTTSTTALISVQVITVLK